MPLCLVWVAGNNTPFPVARLRGRVERIPDEREGSPRKKEAASGYSRRERERSTGKWNTLELGRFVERSKVGG